MVLAISVVPVSTQQPAQPNTAKFVLSSWDYPDEYGQGIEKIEIKDNSTGSWIPQATHYYYESDSYEWGEDETIKDGSIKLTVWTWFNSTLTGAIDFTDGKNYHKHEVTVALQNGTTVFNQQNFTYGGCFPAIDPPQWYYYYEVILNFVPEYGQIYTISVDYEIYYLITEDTTLLTATSGSTDAGTPTGDYTDTHSVNGVFFGGTDPTDMYVTLWVEFSEELGNFNYSIYWNGSTSCNMFVYDHDATDWAVLDLTPNGENGPLAWDNGTVSNEDYYNATHVGFKLWDELNPAIAIYVDYLHIHAAPASGWVVISAATLHVFRIYSPEQIFLGNFFFIVLGLVMVPASTIYLVYGGRDKLTQDKFFYFLIAFIIGWAFIIGGVMP